MFESSKFIMTQKDNVFSLRIKEAQKSDEGNYTILVTNHRGEQAKCSCQLTVQGNNSEKYFFPLIEYNIFFQEMHMAGTDSCNSFHRGGS